MEKHIAESFLDYFNMVPATTTSLKHASYRLRYQVYCLETGFENPKKHNGELETDEYDSRSEHYLIRHRKSGVYAATTRLILPDPNAPEQLFPMEALCQITRADLLRNIPRTHIAEISRFCIAGDFKRRPGEQGTIAGIGPYKMPGADERRTWPHLTLALIACLNKAIVRHGFTHLYSFIEPSFFRLLTILGIYFIPIGPTLEYHDKRRQPCIIQFPEYLDAVKEKNIEIWDMLTDYGRVLHDRGDDEGGDPS